MPGPDPIQSPSFEQSVDQIEAIVSKIESGEFGLEESMAAYEKAVGLIKRCRGELSKAEQRVTELSKAMSDAARQSKSGPEGAGSRGDGPMDPLAERDQEE